VFLLVPAHPGSPGQRAIKRLLLFLWFPGESGLASSVVAWLSGSALVLTNEVTLRRDQLVLGWVTICGRVNHLVVGL